METERQSREYNMTLLLYWISDVETYISLNLSRQQVNIKDVLSLYYQQTASPAN